MRAQYVSNLTYSKPHFGYYKIGMVIIYSYNLGARSELNDKLSLKYMWFQARGMRRLWLQKGNTHFQDVSILTYNTL